MVSYIFFLYIVLLLCYYDCLFCSARDTLTQADPVVDEESGTLVSAGEKFELGFFSPTPIVKSNSGADSRYVGIWYHKVTPRTFVWVANRDKPLPVNSTGVLTIEDSNLRVLDNVTGETYWSTDIGTSSSSNMIVKIMESGNLVLMDSDQMAANILWQSFQNPTDTFIPGMLMDKNFQLTSWRDQDDPRPGNFNFKLDQSKNQYIVMNRSLPYWKSGEPGNRFSPYEVPPKVDGLLSYYSSSRSTDTSPPSINFTMVRPSDYNYTRLVISFTGELQFYTWDDSKKQWSLSWSEPKDHCSKFNPCGSFGSCNNNNWPLVCKCLPGFKPKSPDNWNSGDFSRGCDRESSMSDNNSTFLSLNMMKVGEAESPFDVGSETECRKECRQNPQCQAYSYAVLPNDRAQRGGTTTTSTSLCWTWLEDLNNLVEEYVGGHNICVRVASSDIESTVRDCEPCGTTMIPYPLSTGVDCGDPMYFRFNCNTLTGQVSFVVLNDTFRVISIEPSMQKIVLKGLPAKMVGECDSRNRDIILQLNTLFPFKLSSWCEADLGDFNEVEVGWELPPEPACNTPADCKGWPNSTCNRARDGMKRCLCNKSFKWNAYNFNCTQGSLHEPSNSPSFLGEHSSRKVSFYLIIVAVLISMILLACIISIYIWRRKMTRKQDQISRAQFGSERRVKELIDTSEFNEEDEKGIDVPFFDLQSILEATDNFSDANKLGQGGYGPVYKGKFFGGQEIAVKRLSKVSGQGLQEFRNEVVLIAKLQHRNLVRLRGYCMKGEEKILLYEYMPNKSLDSFIFDHTQNVFLNWEMRFNIILGIARGLVYLHQDSRLRIIHRDLKTSNVLLDEEMNPKISDFGLARIVGGKETEANTNTVVGTYGYMSPEYALDGTFSVKSDVFSFGVVLLEIISGKKNAGFFQSKQTFSLLGYAWELWTEDKVLDLMDKNLEESCNRSEFIKCVNVGLLCVQEDPVDRPTMSNVITLLYSETAIPASPKQPAFFIRRGNSSTASSSTKPETVSEITTLEGEKFELGFFTPNGSSATRRYIGIWYYRSNPQTVVWVANRDNPLSDTRGVFAIAEDGNLKVLDGKRKTYWSSSLESSSSTITTAKLMDTGNLVVSNREQGNNSVQIVWQSFENPTDTFLPGMKMRGKLVLSSWKSYNDPATGNFTFQQDQEEANHFVIWKRSRRYWKSEDYGNFISSDEMASAILYLLSNFTSTAVHNDSVPYLTSSLYTSTRLVMSFSGQIQYLMWDSEKVWSLIWADPRDRCSVYNACGNFGSCNSKNGLVCKCLPGFKPSSPDNWNHGDYSGGCTRKSTLCGNNAESDTFLSLKMMKVGNPDSQFNAKSEVECRVECLNNCECQAYFYEEVENKKTGGSGSSTCWIWSQDVTNLQEDYDGGQNLQVRVAVSDIESTARSCGSCGTNLIPYPLSTGPKCGDLTYYSFHCNISTGQLSFEAPSGTYHVTSINSDTQTFVIQANDADECKDNKFLKLIQSSPYNVTNMCNADPTRFSRDLTFKGGYEVEVAWESPLEPPCSSSTDCKDWPRSICDATLDGKKRCLCPTNSKWDSRSLNCTQEVGHRKQTGEQGKMTLALIIAVTCISVAVLAILSSTFVYAYIWRRRRVKTQEGRANLQKCSTLNHFYDSERKVKNLIESGRFKDDDTEGIDVPSFDLESILVATTYFSNANKLGQGGFGPVYKGKLPGGEEIAVKRLSSCSGQGLEEFKNEVLLIAKLQHRNLVRLLGYCAEGDEKMLIYEYMANKSLDSFIFDRKVCVSLDWNTRFNIILGIARGLLYLHQDSRLRVIHRDLKTSNILLSEEMNPKISDFGLARIFGGNETSANTNRVVGTYGYMSPEYALDGLFSVKSDVFSFGVVVIEIITGKRNTGFYQPERSLSLLGYAWHLWKEQKALDLLEQTLGHSCNKDEYFKCVNVGLLCVQEDPGDRPTMSQVVFMLGSETATIPTPKQPAFVVRRCPSSSSRASNSSSKPETVSNNGLTVTLEDGR